MEAIKNILVAAFERHALDNFIYLILKLGIFSSIS